MHLDKYTPSQIAAMRVKNWFALRDAELNDMIPVLIEDVRPRPHVRIGTEVNEPPKYIKGVPAVNIQGELMALAEQTKEILAENQRDSALRAVAFYHLRYEGIHALTDGNGRTGRLIMAQQFLARGWPGSVETFIEGIADNDPFYRMVFLSRIPDDQRYELLLDLLSRIVGVSGDSSRVGLPFPIAPNDTERVNGRFRFVPLPVSAETRALIETELQKGG